MAPDGQEREGGELQGGCGNEQWHAGAENSSAARERASGERCHEVPWREKWGEEDLAAAVAPHCCGMGSGAHLSPVRRHNGQSFLRQRHISLESSELLPCPDPASRRCNMSAKILGTSLCLCAPPHGGPGIIRSYVIPPAERGSHPQEHWALMASSVPASSTSPTALWAEQRGGGKMGTRCIPAQPTCITACVVAVGITKGTWPWASQSPYQGQCRSTDPRWKPASGLQHMICRKPGSFPI